MDITYIPMARRFIYLAAVMDWFTRRVAPRPPGEIVKRRRPIAILDGGLRRRICLFLPGWVRGHHGVR